MKLFIIPLFAVLLTLTGCGYDGHYRYPCQDPANFQNEECLPPLCKVSGTCTIDILGFDPETGKELESEENE
jgi:hypothetical protein